MSMIRTVLGDIPPAELGVTHGHEHVLFSPDPHFGDDLQRSEAERAVKELRTFRDAGGGGLIDATVEELGRDVVSLARISALSGVQVVAATGHTAEEWWWERSDPRRQNRDQIVKEMTTDLTVGINDTGIRAGIIKVGTSRDLITEGESRVMESAALVHAATGASITTHTTAGTVALRQATALMDMGVDPSRLCIGHLDRNLDSQLHLAVAHTGVYVGYDQISKERHGPDRLRAEFVARLVAEGYADRILLGSDLARRSDFPQWGGSTGLSFLLRSFVPLLQSRGLDDAAIATILVENPRRFLAWA